MAERAGVNVETLRYYERRGLLPEPPRGEGGHREYGADAIRFVRAVKEAQSLGFSLAEIEEYLRLTRRDPRVASGAARERLTGKLDDDEAAMAALRTRRAGLERALYEVWEPLERSTSNAAYLARGGRDPVLGTGPLHVTNGESVAGTLRATSLEGVVLSWDDVLHVGALAFDPEESRALRARFLGEHGWGSEDAIDAELTRRDELLAQAERIVLWFEHDLVDQLQLLQILAQLDDNIDVELVQADDYLGPLEGRGAGAALAFAPAGRTRSPAARSACVARGVRGGDRAEAQPGAAASRGCLAAAARGARSAFSHEAAAAGGPPRRPAAAARALLG